MVLKGQFLERQTLIPVGSGLVLEALSHRGTRSPGLLILPPAPVEGSGMDDVVAAEVVFAAVRAGHPTLRFNYRGVGASQGTRSREPEDLFEDARSALELLAANAQGMRLAVASLGASDAIGLRLAQTSALAALVIINPALVVPEDLRHVPPGVAVSVVVAEREAAGRSRAWEAELGGCRATVVVVPHKHQIQSFLPSFVGACEANE